MVVLVHEVLEHLRGKAADVSANRGGERVITSQCAGTHTGTGQWRWSGRLTYGAQLSHDWHPLQIAWFALENLSSAQGTHGLHFLLHMVAVRERQSTWPPKGL